MTTIPVDISDIAEMIADTTAFTSQNGEHRNPDSPSFIFRDERGSEPSDILWGRDLALDFEEWKAKQEQRQQYLSGKLLPAFIPTHVEPKANAMEFILATMDEVEAWMDKPTADRKPVMVWRDDEGVLHEWQASTPAEERNTFKVCTYKNLSAYLDDQWNKANPVYDDNGVLTNPFKGIELQIKDSKEVDLHEAHQEDGKNRWITNWNKKIKHANQELMADCLRKGIAKLADVLDDPEFGPYALATHRAAKEVFKDAPKKLDGVYYINPDGKRVKAREGLQYSKAKAGYQERHGIEERLVTMDRVQYEGALTSHYVIGTRKASDKTASSYYDPDPVKGDHGYIPRACTLIKVPDSKVMPDEQCYRLTVRELERAIIAGANLVESDIEAFADSFDDTDECFDTRESGISFDNSCDFRTLGDLDEQEQWLYWQFVSAGMEMASQALLVAECGDIARFLPGLDGACLKMATDEALTEDEEIALNLLEQAREDDLLELEKTGRVQWSRFDMLRSLGQSQEARTLRNRIADLSPEAIATYGGEPHAIDQMNYSNPFEHQIPNTGRRYRYTTWK